MAQPLRYPRDSRLVLYVTDLHASPHLDPTPSRFEKLGEWERQLRPDLTVFGGDMWTWDSCSRHEAHGTLKAREVKPPVEKDEICVRESLEAYDASRRESVPVYATLGNHDWDRPAKFENDHPEWEGLMKRYIRTLEAHLTDFVPYAQWLHIGPVGFTHFPIQLAANREYGGNNWWNMVSRDSPFDVVCGHTHKRAVVPFPRQGRRRPFWVINGGTALPDGHLEHYLRHAPGVGWTYGVTLLWIDSLGIAKEEWVPIGCVYGEG